MNIELDPSIPTYFGFDTIPTDADLIHLAELLEFQKSAVKEIEDYSKTLREICKRRAVKEEGATSIKVAEDVTVTVTRNLRRTIKADQIGELNVALIDANPDEAGEIIKRVINWKPEVSASGLKGLYEKDRAIVEQYIETKEGPPTVEIKTKK